MLRSFLLRRADLPPADWARWHGAHTLADLGELTASWLEGTLTTHAGYGDPDHPGPDPETAPLISTLAAVNRAGPLTISSQPATLPERGFDGTRLGAARRRRSPLRRSHPGRLYELVADTDLLVIVHRGARRWPWGRDDRKAVTVTRWNNRDYTGFGTRLDRSDLRLQFGASRARLHCRLYRAWQVTVTDPRTGAATPCCGRCWTASPASEHRCGSRSRPGPTGTSSVVSVGWLSITCL